MKKSTNNCIGYIGQPPKITIFETSKNPHPRKSKSASKFQCFYMKWSTVQHMETLTPSSILIFQGASVGTGLRFFKVVPERLFQKSAEHHVFLHIEKVKNKQIEHFRKKCNLVINDHLLRPKNSSLPQ